MATGVSLHIGLNRVDPNHYKDQYGRPWNGALAGCENDAHDMQALANAQGFKTQIMLNDAATADGVMAAIKAAAGELASGDIFFLTYSGHGGQVPDRNGDEPDDMDETWCCFDRQLIDDELYALWSQFAPGVRILMLSDSCHSGSVAKDPDLQKVLANVGQPRVLPDEVQVQTYKENAALYDDLQKGLPCSEDQAIGASVILISGCKDNQTSADGDKNGLFTERLLQVWDKGNFQGSLKAFQKKVLMQMPWYQSPQYFKTGAPNADFERQRPFTI